jgi:uncharacterized membrane protein YccC
MGGIMSVGYQALLFVVGLTICVLFGYLWIAMRRGALWANIAYIVLAGLNIGAGMRFGVPGTIGGILGVALYTIIGWFVLRLLPRKRVIKAAEEVQQPND